MSGEHVFEIRLFIAATALTFFSVAVTQAGWRHKVFVNGLFVCGLALFATAIFWPAIAPLVPNKLDTSLGDVASNATAWLILAMLTTSAICLLDYRARSKWQKEFPNVVRLLEEGNFAPLPSTSLAASSTRDNRSWFSSYDIILLADLAIRERMGNAKAEAEKIQKQIAAYAAERKKLQPNDRFAGLVPMNNPPEGLEILQEKAAEAQAQLAAQEMAYTRVHAEALRDVYAKLQAGVLVAKGFLDPIDADSTEVEIPSARWRFLQFQGDYKQAMGQGIKYVGIALARAS
jgi:hypothetical protein